MTKLYQNIQTIRKERNIKSIRQLEILSGIHEGTIKKWKDRLPSCALLIQLATYLKISTDSLLGLNEENLSTETITDPNIERIVKELMSLEINEHDADIALKILRIISKRTLDAKQKRMVL